MELEFVDLNTISLEELLELTNKSNELLNELETLGVEANE